MTVIINSIVGRDVLGAYSFFSCHKAAIYALVGPAQQDLDGWNGVDRNTFVLPEGCFASVGVSNMEVQPLIRNRNGVLQPTHVSLYDMDNPMTAELALAEAERRKVPVATFEKVALALEMFGAEMPFAWYNSNGHVNAFRLPSGVGAIEIPKPAWGSVQEGDGSDVLVYNNITTEIYKIGKEEFLSQWFSDDNPQAKGEDFYQLIPVIHADLFAAICYHGDLTAQQLLEQQKSA